jgi:hypothetical protein
MVEQLRKWTGRLNINGTEYDSISDVPKDIEITGTTVITLIPRQTIKPVQDKAQHIIVVKRYMTEKSSGGFDFMKKWNNDVPMPMCTMVGTVEKETRGMVYMKLHGELLAERTFTCMCCGRPLTNPVSQFFGVGPECGGHNYTHPFDTDEELRQAVDAYKKVLLNKTWEGWIIKSAIKEDTIKEEVV